MTKLTFLVDNRGAKPFLTEHGFALFIQTENQAVLFDTGQNREPLFHNAQELSIDLTSLATVVLSHGHYDHSGNMAKLIKLNPQVTIAAHPGCTIPRYSIHADRNPQVSEIGLTTSNKQALMNLSYTQHLWCHGVSAIAPSIFATGSIPRVTPFEDTGGPFFLESKGTTADLIEDDMAIFIEGEDSTTVISGCCHAGLVNTLMHIEKHTTKPITTVLGGFHLLHADKNRMDETIAYLNSSTVTKLYPSHCTGESAMKELEKKLSAEVIYGEVGLVLEV